MSDSSPPAHRGAARTPAPAPPPRRLDSETVFAGANEVLIRHQGVEYRLRKTGQGKLILTK
jgi:hemin uptake protein HemP